MSTLQFRAGQGMGVRPGRLSRTAAVAGAGERLPDVLVSVSVWAGAWIRDLMTDFLGRARRVGPGFPSGCHQIAFALERAVREIMSAHPVLKEFHAWSRPVPGPKLVASSRVGL